MYTNEEMIKIIKAFENGETIEVSTNNSKWIETTKPTWNWEDNNYRIKEKEVDYSWRLPTIEELTTLINFEKTNPACDFEDTRPNFYLSSTLNSSYTSFLWCIHFEYGKLDSKLANNKYYVRCVRMKSDDTLEWSKTTEYGLTREGAIEYAKTLTDNDVYIKQ